MSEFEPKYEKGKESQLDKESLEKLSKENYERLEKKAAEAEAKRDSIEAIQERIEKAASNKEATKDKLETAASERPLHTGHKLRTHSYKQTVKRTQKQLPLPQRTFSKLIHQPVVETLSNIGESTVARPSGLLMGGLFSVISSLAILYICRHYGYEYNFLVGLLAFAGGFVLGIIVEGLGKAFKK